MAQHSVQLGNSARFKSSYLYTTTRVPGTGTGTVTIATVLASVVLGSAVSAAVPVHRQNSRELLKKDLRKDSLCGTTTEQRQYVRTPTWYSSTVHSVTVSSNFSVR